MKKANRYSQIIETIFDRHYRKGDSRVEFSRDEIQDVSRTLRITLPKNIGDIIYTFRYRGDMPESISSRAPVGHDWIIMPAGRGQYRFEATTLSVIVPAAGLVQTKIPDGTPGVIAKYALSDEQALLARLRYNRLIDIFTGVACYSLQSHLRSFVADLGQVETDELYVGLDKKGCHYVFPVQAKGGRDKMSIVQIIQDFALCKERFAALVCRPIAAQFMADEAIALFEFEQTDSGFGISAERHYRLVPPEEVTEADIAQYGRRGD